MLDVLISGKLLRDPVTRVGPSGKPFCTALLRVPVDREDAVLANVIAFQDMAEGLGQLRAGDAVSLAGSAKLNEWRGQDGELKHGLSVTVSGLLSAYDVKKRRATRNDTPARPVLQDQGRAAAAPVADADESPPFDDDIPF